VVDNAAVTAVAPLVLHEDRLLPSEPGARALAHRLYAAVCDLPIVSPHGHVPAAMLAEDEPFANPASLLIAPDHYVTRLLHASGVPLETLGVGTDDLTEAAARASWRALCEHWPVFRGTPVRYWLSSTLTEVFGVTQRPSPETADAIYDQVAARLATADYRPRALYNRFGIDVLATTDSPASDLTAHAKLRTDPAGALNVIPTFRPDRLLEAGAPGWRNALRDLELVSNGDIGTYAGYTAAIEQRRQFFRSQGATATDHSHPDVGCEPLSRREAERIYASALAGTATADEAVAFRRHMLLEMARMSCDDGLVMMLHPGVFRGHHAPTTATFGADTGNDIPVRIEFTRALRPMLERYGTHPNFHLVLFTLDETAWSREIAPLAGFYPSVYIGAPWWFLDAPDAIRRWHADVDETAGFSRTSGFVDDTRAFCSIPARHDMARRLDAGRLAALVAEHRLDEDEAVETAVDLVTRQPRRVFKL
jgi:glucuronate isomerase